MGLLSGLCARDFPSRVCVFGAYVASFPIFSRLFGNPALFRNSGPPVNSGRNCSMQTICLRSLDEGHLDSRVVEEDFIEEIQTGVSGFSFNVFQLT